MTWTYEVSQLATSALYQVRFMIGDTNSAAQQVQDEEINYAISATTSTTAAAIFVLHGLVALYARMADKSVGDLSISYSQRFTHYQELIDLIASGALAGGVAPYSGGISHTDKDLVNADSDRVKPSFERGQFDYPGTSDQSTGFE